jgi:DNA-binding beta-propeller fold protein YncE
VLTSSRTRRITTALLVLGCGLVAIGLFQAVADRPRQVSVSDTAAPTIQVRTRFSGITPGGQTTGFGVAPDGSLAYVDRGRQEVIRLDANGAPLAEWGPYFGGETDAQDLNGIAAAGSDWYVLDRGRSRILQLDTNGRATHSIDLQSLGTYGPNGLAVDTRGNIYLADTGSNRILVFSTAGALLRTIGSPGAELGQLKQPMGLSFGPDGAMYVTDFENNRLERWDDGLQATNAWPLTGHAWGVAVDRLSRVFVPDADHSVVRMYSPRGDLLAEIGGAPDSALAVGAPTQVGLTPDGSALWVLGSEGLARVDLSVYSELVPSGAPRGASFPFVPTGGLLLALGLAPLAFRTLRRPAGSPPRPSRGEAARNERVRGE